jgi:DNA-binding NarL/FixJ family response regulator
MVALQPYKIHILENNRADYIALRRAVRAALAALAADGEFTHHVTANRAYEALLAGQAADLIFVDLNLGAESGLRFLARVREDVRIVPCPKIIFTTSTAESDVKDGFRLGAAGYLVKPLTYAALLEAVTTCLEYWFETSRRPSASAQGDEHRSGTALPRC